MINWDYQDQLRRSHEDFFLFQTTDPKNPFERKTKYQTLNLIQISMTKKKKRDKNYG